MPKLFLLGSATAFFAMGFALAAVRPVSKPIACSALTPFVGINEMPYYVDESLTGTSDCPPSAPYRRARYTHQVYVDDQGEYYYGDKPTITAISSGTSPAPPICKATPLPYGPSPTPSCAE